MNKQETLEELAIQKRNELGLKGTIDGFIAGFEIAKERMYSEEDLKNAFFSGCQSERQIKPRIKCWEEWFKQFKNK